jgi:two-component system, sensor histidine kinase
MNADTQHNPAKTILPWWTWVVPFVVFHAASQFSLLFKYDQGVSTFYVPTAVGIVLIHWWGPARVLPAMFIVATLNTYYWGVDDWTVWPIYAAPEVFSVFLSYFLFRKVMHGRYWISSTRQFIKFTIFGVLIPITTYLLLLQAILTYFGEHAASTYFDHFLRNWLGEFTANFGITIPLLFAGTPILQQRGLLLEPPPKKLRRPVPKTILEKSEIAMISIALLVLSITIPFEKFWFAYGIIALYAAIRFGFRDAVFCNLYVFLITYVLPAFYTDVPTEILENEGSLYSIFLGNLLLSFFVALTGRVISDLRIAEDRLNRQNQELETANNELDRFVYSASHDLSAPLKSILGLVTISKMDSTPDSSKLYLDEIEKSVVKLDSFIGEILDYSRNKRLEISPEQIKLKELCQEILDNLKYTEGYNRVQFDLEELNGKTIRQDKTRLRIILSNLISNAIKFQKTAPWHEPSIKITSAHQQNKTLIKVEDNGEGIHPELSHKVFNMFFRASESSRGSGLGLYIAKESAEKIGGNINLKSEYGKGSVFTIEIPEIA